jgi:hypothetical protein
LMYFGILLNYNGVFTNTQKMLSNQGKKAVFSLFSKIQDDYFNTETLLSLFDTCKKYCKLWMWSVGLPLRCGYWDITFIFFEKSIESKKE